MPARQRLLRAAADIGNMNLNFGGLSDSIQAADPLFQQLRIQRQIEKKQVMRKLEIPTFAADLRRDQEASPVTIRKPGGIAVALNEGQPFVEHGKFHMD